MILTPGSLEVLEISKIGEKLPKRLIIDTNLLLLLIIGGVEGGRHIKNSKRLSSFDMDDYDSVLKIMGMHDELFITPYIATEISNLIDLNGHAGILARGIAKSYFSKICKKIEVDIEEDCSSDYFIRYGITDASLIKLAHDYYILTNDHRMLEPLYTANLSNIIPYDVIKNRR